MAVRVVPEIGELRRLGQVGSKARGFGAVVGLHHVAVTIARVGNIARTAARRLGALGRAGRRGALQARRAGAGRCGAFVTPEALRHMSVEGHVAFSLDDFIAVFIDTPDAHGIPVCGRPTVHARAVLARLAMLQARVGAGRRVRVLGQARIGARGRRRVRLGRVCASQGLTDRLVVEDISGRRAMV